MSACQPDSRPIERGSAQGPERCGLDELDGGNGTVAQPLDTRQLGRGGRHQHREAAKFFEQPLGQWLGVAAGYGKAEQIFEQLVIMETVTAAGKQPRPQPLPVAGAIFAHKL